MAKDLGTITHKITTGEGSGGGGGASSTDARSGSGRGGGVGDVIRGVSRGGVLGGAQAMAKVGGYAKLALKIGVAIAAFGLLAMGVKKVISTLFKWSREIENGITKFSAYNGVLAVAAARMEIGKITRNIKSANVLQNLYARTGANLEAIKDSFRPVKDAWSAVKASILNALMPTIQSLVNGLRAIMIVIFEMWLALKEKQMSILRVATFVLSPSTMLYRPIPQRDEEGIETIKRILKALEESNQDNAIKELNQIVGAIGVQLTGGAWNPWSKGIVGWVDDRPDPVRPVHFPGDLDDY